MGATIAAWLLGMGYQVIQRGSLPKALNEPVEIIGESLGMITVAAGLALVVSAVVALMIMVFSGSFSKWLGRSYSVFVIGTMGVSLLGNQLAKGQGDRADARNAIAGIESDMKSFFGQSPGGGNPPAIRKGAAGNDLEIVRQIQQEMIRDMTEVQTDYAAALETAGLPQLLDAERVQRDVRFTESRQLLRQLLTVVRTYRKRALTVIESIPSRFEAFEFDHASQSELRDNYTKGLAKAMPVMDEIWNLESDIILYFEEVIDHLEASRGYWRPENGAFAFDRTADLERYNEIMAKVNAASQRQADLRKNTLTDTLQKLDALKTEISN